MRRREYEPEFWHLLAAEPGIESRFKRWNLIIISILAFVLLGAFVAALGSRVIYSPTAGKVAPQAAHHAAKQG